MARPSVREVLAREGEGLARGHDAEAQARAALAALDGLRTPWYLRVLLAAGAWMGAGFLLSFLLTLLAIPFGDRFDVVAIAGGLGLIAAALAGRLRGLLEGEFWRQVSLVVSFTGHMLFIGGVGGATDETLACLAAMLVSVPVLLLFPDRVHRFCSTILTAGAAAVLLVERQVPYGIETLSVALAGLGLVLFRLAPPPTRFERQEVIEPAAHGMVIALLGVVLAAAVAAVAGSPPGALRMGLVATMGITAVLVTLMTLVMEELDVPLTSTPALLAFALVLVLAFVTRRTPSIVTTLLVVALAFDRRERGLVALSAAFLIVFATLYYYSLDLTLLQKSGVLAASGALSIAAAAWIRWRGVEEIG